MKFSCEKALLQSAISTTSRATAAKSSIPALEGILLEAGEELRFTGYNLETGIRTTVPAEVRESGSLVLSARKFAAEEFDEADTGQKNTAGHKTDTEEGAHV